MIVNLNCLCKVYLNDLGKQIWLAQLEQLSSEIKKDHPEIEKTIKSAIQPDDSIELELWTIMNVFGPYTSLVTCPFKTVTMELNKNPNFGNYFTTITSNNQKEVISDDEQGTSD
jgi:hypothetical protein